MSISRERRHKRRATGGKRTNNIKKRKYELGRPAAMTKLGPKRIHLLRVRGGSIKNRAMRLDSGNFSWGSEALTRKTRVLDVVYNASNNELVRTKTLVKNAIVVVDAAPFRQFYENHYAIILGKKKDGEEVFEEKKTDLSKTKAKTVEKRNKDRIIDPAVSEQFKSGRLLAAIASRPGQSGRCDGYILEGPELQFYLKKLHKKKGAAAKA
ncbi:40S small subunit ribosomal protein eS8 (rpS8) [Andalucia godoyi]|uniref:40S ribosomal protein S8 n=1 Tax=Andalucia godoyi TaxID=505711 RepID=A0A8K0AG65_ANDGO|nr:40S small subunit ribosomal protein eS8 (rpS8) [Andalucia godoyi]|eukprot:ANDGO_08005.mRNA.1 40S small subunit ribosomal protein eS8 (rpS8)